MSDMKQKISRLETLIERADKVLADKSASPEQMIAAERVKKGAAVMLGHRKQRQQAAGLSLNQNVINNQGSDTGIPSQSPHLSSGQGSNIWAEVRSVFFNDSYDENIDLLNRNDRLWRQAQKHIQQYIRVPLPWYQYVIGLFVFGSFAAGIAFGKPPSLFGEFSIFAFSFFFGLWIAYDKQASYKAALREEYWRLEAVSGTKTQHPPAKTSTY